MKIQSNGRNKRKIGNCKTVISLNQGCLFEFGHHALKPCIQCTSGFQNVWFDNSIRVSSIRRIMLTPN